MKRSPEIGDLVRELRVAKGMTQGDFARVLHVNQSRVSEWETGVATPPADACIALGNLAPYPNCLFFYEKAGMDLKRVTQVGKALDVCLDFIKRMDSRTHEQLQGHMIGMDREEQLDRVLESMGGLGGLVRIQCFDEVASAFLQVVEQLDPAEARELERHLGFGSPYDKIKRMRGTAARLLRLKTKRDPRDRWDKR
jgi:DNA-binding XRE family transcriptional regulator